MEWQVVIYLGNAQNLFDDINVKRRFRRRKMYVFQE